ncbi:MULTISPECIES: hypothetical protein [Prauserella salsuginis group]|uniref:Secreted protein n=1 Tax=Prauserella salsuginis TaxID=387889 RepID=A0ABW6G002_9PSEU|nr:MULTISPECIES: hypothetical protein [Prauserella salsuginis group]
MELIYTTNTHISHQGKRELMNTVKKAAAASVLTLSTAGMSLLAVTSPAWANPTEPADSGAPRAGCTVHAWDPTQSGNTLTGRAGTNCHRGETVGGTLYIDYNNWPDSDVANGATSAPGYYDVNAKCGARNAYYLEGVVSYINKDGWRAWATHESGHPTLC